MTPDQFPLIIAHTSPRDKKSFEMAIETLTKAIEEGGITPVAYKDAKDSINYASRKAYDALIREKYPMQASSATCPPRNMNSTTTATSFIALSVC